MKIIPQKYFDIFVPSDLDLKAFDLKFVIPVIQSCLHKI